VIAHAKAMLAWWGAVCDEKAFIGRWSFSYRAALSRISSGTTGKRDLFSGFSVAFQWGLYRISA
jgi:hypothetical protein